MSYEGSFTLILNQEFMRLCGGPPHFSIEALSDCILGCQYTANVPLKLFEEYILAGVPEMVDTWMPKYDNL